MNGAMLELPSGPLLTACLSCSWVHEFPGKCPRSSETWRKLREEYTANLPGGFPRRGVTASPPRCFHGTNALIVPRGIYYDTAFHKLLNDTWANASSSPLVGATVIGNEAGNARGLNARVAQLLVSHNVTAAQAESLLTKLLTNKTGGKIAAVLDVTGEFYTLGFVNDAADLVPNVAVENTGHYAAPAPPPGSAFWTAYWNAMAGAVAYAWDAARAAAVFVANVIAAAVQWALSVVSAFVEAAYAAVKAVAKAVVDAILAFVKFLVELIHATLDFIVQPLVDGVKGLLDAFRAGFMAIYREGKAQYLAQGSVEPGTRHKMAAFVFGGMFLMVAAFGIAVWLLTTVLLPIIGPFVFLIPLIGALIAAALIVQAFDLPEQAPATADPPLTHDRDQQLEYSREYSMNPHNDDLLSDEQWDFLALLLDGTAILLDGLAAILFYQKMKDVIPFPAREAIAGMAGGLIATALSYVATWFSGAGESKGLAAIALFVSIGAVVDSLISGLTFWSEGDTGSAGLAIIALVLSFTSLGISGYVFFKP